MQNSSQRLRDNCILTLMQHIEQSKELKSHNMMLR